MTIGVRELKEHLSETLRRVQAGERLTITQHGRPIATLAPALEAPKWLLQMIAEGKAQWSGGKPTGLNPPIPSRGKPASQMVIEDRRRR